MNIPIVPISDRVGGLCVGRTFLSDPFDVEAEFGPTHKGKTKVKGVGQECPTHTVGALSHPLKTAKSGAASVKVIQWKIQEVGQSAPHSFHPCRRYRNP